MASSDPGALLPLQADQARASDPGGHVWLSASAGTGKTYVLAARVFRLLLNGVNPEHILCLTFTKAGAAEMAERIHTRLAKWVQMDGPALAADLRALGEDYGPDAQDRARRLFAEVLEATGGGLRIQTIHSFCQQLLSSFPLEADLVPGFRPLDEREQSVLARNALADMLVDAEARGDTRLVGAVQALSLRLGEGEAEAFLHHAARAGDGLTGLPEDIRGWLYAKFGLPVGDIEAAIAAQCGDDCFDADALRWIAAENATWGSKRGQDHHGAILEWTALTVEDRAARLMLVHSVWSNSKGELKAAKGWVPPTPGYVEATEPFHRSCSELIAMREKAKYADLLAEALHAGRAFAAAYAEAKRNAGAIDFDDLIRRTVALLAEPGMGEWIRYKLDQRTDHILVDEAQDTNQAQWSIVRTLAEEYFVYLDPDEASRGRTLFVVGDCKQAIFGFQGTSPQAFRLAQQGFDLLAQLGEQNIDQVALLKSHRSVPAVLEVVDATVAALGPETLGLEPAAVEHDSARRFPGEVQLWPVVTAEAPEDDGEENWLSDHVRNFAVRLAKQIRAWISQGLMLEAKGRPIQAGDIMILVRSRGDLARLIVARLYEEGVPVAGIDRLRLNDPLAVRDLLAAVRFALQPQDDLNLANLLVSPLVGWSQDELMQRAPRPRGMPLWAHLRATLSEDLLTPLYALLGQADWTTPYRYLEHILSGPLDGRRKLLARLGTEARDPIEELLNQALAFERDGNPSLQRFVDWFDRGNVDIVRDAAGAGGAVRVLTVHGAKGLQAPMVILADATHDPDAGNRRPRLEWQTDMATLPLVPPRKTERFGPIGEIAAEAEALERQEHWRLLYVALTRAEERLVVAGAVGSRGLSDESWYSAVARGFDRLGAEETGEGLRIWRGRERHSPAKSQASDKVAAGAVAVPEWARRAAPAEARPPRPLAPSAQPEDQTPDPPPSPGMRAAAERGRLLHGLFERLPSIDPARRDAAALRWLARQASDMAEEMRETLAADALRIIADPRFEDVFAPDALAEAPIAAIVGEAVIAGTVDRLCIGADRVLVVDFKTGSRVPASEEEAPVAHVRQMAAYRAALQVVFPGKAVTAALLYTAGPRLLPLSEPLLDRYKPGFASAEDNF